jgi:hypothetical protein
MPRAHTPDAPAPAPAASSGWDASRRTALAKLGIVAGTAYFAPTVVQLDRAVALVCPSGEVDEGGHCQKRSSDVRLKRDIVPVARRADGIGLYRYRYHWSDRLWVGVMAQEVAAIVPDAVSRGAAGFLEVDYARLGLALMTWAEWQAQSDVRNAA